MTLLINTPDNLGSYNGFYMMHMDESMNVPGTRYTSCRETFCAGIRHKYDKSRIGCKPINTRRMYVLVTRGKANGTIIAKKKILREMDRSLKLVNSFERKYKWILSKTKYADDRRKNTHVPSVLFLGCRKWVSSTYLVSFYTLLLRLGTHEWIPNDVFDEPDHEKLVEKLKKVCSINKSNNRDAIHIHMSLDTACFLMENYNNLFSEKSAKYYWSSDRLIKNSRAYNEGIRLLADGSSRYRELNDKCRKFRGELRKRNKQKEKIITKKLSKILHQ